MSPELRRSENLALIFQEVLTAIERLRANRQGVADPQAFRHHTREALKTAANRALGAGYANEDVKFATFVAIAFLDESVLNSRNPVFAEWLRKPMQEELFGTHIAGEVVFQNLQQILGRTDSPDLADVLEVHHLCLLLDSAAAIAPATAANWRRWSISSATGSGGSGVHGGRSLRHGRCRTSRRGRRGATRG